MSQLIDLYIKKDVIVELLKAMEAKAKAGDESFAKGVNITVSVNDDVNEHGQNVYGFVAQSKEQREAKKPKFYFGNGKTFWANKGEYVPRKKETATGTSKVLPDYDDDLPI